MVEQMKQLTFVPSVELQQASKTPSAEITNTKILEKSSSNYDVLSNIIKKDEIQEKNSIGIETGMVYIAIPISVAVWVGIMYIVKLIFF
jgi:hypothetical protein